MEKGFQNPEGGPAQGELCVWRAGQRFCGVGGFESMNASRQKKLDAQHEKIIRNLLRLPQNRQCMTCATKTTPQYVCTTFCTFICTTCSGVHRGFGYRVKSISYASFTPQEVEDLKNGGNEAARRKYLATWTKDQINVPDEG